MQRRAGTTIVALAALAAGLTGAVGAGTARLVAQRGGAAAPPAYQVDPLWPKPLPNHWILGSVTGVAVDSRDHVWIVHRGADSLNARTEMGLASTPPSAEECCAPAPPVLQFDPAGNLVGHWGGPGAGYTWPTTPGGIAIDPKGNVWITAAGWPEPAAARGGGAGRRGAGGGRAGAGGAPAPPPPTVRPHDAHILKFSSTGQFLQQFGKPGASDGNASQTTFNKPAGLDLDPSANELYVADGHDNRRVVVLDAATGAYKRHWGAYGTPPDETNPGPYDPAQPAAKQFRLVSCVAVAGDGLVYVCDRTGNRIQVFRKNGGFVSEAVIAKATLGNGAVWDVAFSSDPQQRHLFVADGQNHTVTILQRDTMQVVGQIGSGGRWPGHFYAVGSVAVDSRGNLYTGETFEGKRVQKFLPRR